jgi:N-acetyl-gamma-glutamylphosphate reductase
MFFKHHDLNVIFRKLLGVPEELLEEYFQSKYDIPSIVGTREEAKKLPLSKKMAQELHKHINEKTKKLDLDILFLASFHDMSNECTDHLHTHNINTESIVENYKKLTKNPLITQM